MARIAKQSSSLTIDIVDMSGKKVDTVSVSPSIFSADVSDVLLSQAVRVHLARARSGTRSTKTRSEVTGSTKKIFRQKGTGNARHGSRKAPLFVGGGVAHGPKPQDFSLDMSKTMRRKALFGALTKRFSSGSIAVVRGFETMEPKTKVMKEAMDAIFPAKEGETKTYTTMLVIDGTIESVRRAGGNLPYMSVMQASQLNAYDVLRHMRVVIAEQALATIEKTFTKKTV